MARFAAKHWFLLALVICFGVGYCFPAHLQLITKSSHLRGGLVFTVMWLMGVTLHPDAVRRSLKRPGPSLLAIAINVWVVPLACLPFWWVLPERAFGGLFVAALVPCTLASASVWTRNAGGDDSIAMMNTVVTNLACVFVVPAGVAWVLAQQTRISPSDQMIKLAILVVLPLLVAQAMRLFLGAWADRNKKRISTIAQVGILAMVMIGASTTSKFLERSTGTWWDPLLLIGVTILVHSAVLWLGVFSAARLKMSPEQQIAVGISGSQKTLMVGLQVAIDCGVSVLPMLAYHICQLIIDTIVASRWATRYGASSETVESDTKGESDE